VIADRDAATAAVVGDLLTDPRARRAIGERARAWALRELGWATVADRYDELYARLLRRDRRESSGGDPPGMVAPDGR